MWTSKDGMARSNAPLDGKVFPPGSSIEEVKAGHRRLRWASARKVTKARCRRRCGPRRTGCDGVGSSRKRQPSPRN